MVERPQAAQPLLSGPSSSDHVLHGEILPPKAKRSRAVAQPIAGKGLTTDVQVKAVGVGVHKIAGSTGLTLKVGKSGGGSYVLRYRFAGRRREIGLGSRRDVSLAEALKRAGEQRVLRGREVDPIEERRRVREELAAKARAAKPVTFRDMIGRFLDEHAPDWKRLNARTAWYSPIARYAYPLIKQKGVDEIDVADVRAIIAAAKKGWLQEGRRQGSLADRSGVEFRDPPRPSQRRQAQPGERQAASETEEEDQARCISALVEFEDCAVDFPRA